MKIEQKTGQSRKPEANVNRLLDSGAVYDNGVTGARIAVPIPRQRGVDTEQMVVKIPTQHDGPARIALAHYSPTPQPVEGLGTSPATAGFTWQEGNFVGTQSFIVVGNEIQYSDTDQAVQEEIAQQLSQAVVFDPERHEAGISPSGSVDLVNRGIGGTALRMVRMQERHSPAAFDAGAFAAHVADILQ